jgi:hypothetical protein
LKPFRNVEDLKAENLTWDECFHAWKENTDSFSLQIYNNMQDYYIGRLQASETQKNRFVNYYINFEYLYIYISYLLFMRRENQFFDEDPQYDSDQDIPMYKPPADIFDTQSDSGDFNVNMLEIDNILESSIETESNTIDPTNCPTSLPIDPDCNEYLDIIDSNFMFENIIQDSTNVSTQFNSDQIGFLTKQKVAINSDLNSWLKSKHKHIILPAEEININEPRHYDTSVELINDMMELKNRKFPSFDFTLIVNNTTKRPSITQVSQLFTLNAKQHALFATISLSLLKLWENRLLNNLNYQHQVVTVTKTFQKLFFLTGEGGTGKSRCIDAIQHFCNMWDQSNAVSKTAMTGKAAVCVKGMFIFRTPKLLFLIFFY